MSSYRILVTGPPFYQANQVFQVLKENSLSTVTFIQDALLDHYDAAIIIAPSVPISHIYSNEIYRRYGKIPILFLYSGNDIHTPSIPNEVVASITLDRKEINEYLTQIIFRIITKQVQSKL